MPRRRSAKKVGVLAIQGDFEAHASVLAKLGAEVTKVRSVADLHGLDALVIPGGESTTMAKGLARLGLYDVLRERIGSGELAALGTCAGAILLARAVENGPIPVLGAVDVVAARNAYGTQVDSFASELDPGADAGLAGMRCIFIRAPRLHQPGPGVEVLARVGGEPVLVRERRVLAATFHPELTPDTRVHELLLAVT